MDKIPDNQKSHEGGGWSQFEEWAGMKWFGNEPVTPPEEHDKHPITCDCPDCK